MMYPLSKLLFVGSICLVLLNAHVARATKTAIISLPGRTVQLRGAIADWGYQFNEGEVHGATLMLPPTEEDQFLCSYPSSLEDAPSRTDLSPIALLVSRGECTFEQKAKVAEAIQQNFTRGLQYMIIYNNDPENPARLISLGSSSRVPSLGIVSISTRAGSYTLSSILYWADTTKRSPYLAANVTDWEYPIEIEEWTRRTGRSGSPQAATFYWLRFVLFTLLIVSPCLRAAYLWWNGGGRIALRRNERGRVVGLEYRRPIPYWFAPSVGERRQQRSRLLTEEQVQALPEITYVPPPSTEEDDSVYSDDDNDEEAQRPVDDPSTDTVGEEAQHHVAVSDNTTTEANAVVEGRDDVESPPVDPPSEELTTSCTTCSICIDDFEAGERLRVLPKCRHAFHTECIMPWLTERQGCCPLCKTSVLEEDDDDEEEETESDHAERSNNSEGTDNEEGSNNAEDTDTSEASGNTERTESQDRNGQNENDGSREQRPDNSPV